MALSQKILGEYEVMISDRPIFLVHRRPLEEALGRTEECPTATNYNDNSVALTPLTCEEGSLPRRCLARSSTDHVSHEHLFHVLRFQPCTGGNRVANICQATADRMCRSSVDESRDDAGSELQVKKAKRSIRLRT